MRFLIVSFLSGCACFVSSAGGAEMRTWTAAAGGFTVEAELVELKAGDVVRLKTKDGREIDVPLGQLSAADQAFVRPSAIAPSTVMPEKPSAAFVRAMKAADRCRNPDEAIVVLKVFVDDPQHAPAERAYATGRIAECQDAAAKNQVRVNKKWVAKEEADAVRKKADELMRQGLALLKLDQEDAFKRKFTEAAALEPEEIRAEFLMGLIYTFGRKADKALPIFQKCLVRDPENVAVLNNVAMLAAAKRDYNTASSAWRRALDFQPDQRVVHNIGRFLEQATETRSAIPKTMTDQLSLPYAELISSGKFEETSEKVGWLLMLIEASDLDISLEDDKEKQEQKSPAPEPNDDGTVVGSGTGFVIHPGYVLTNAHVAIADAAFEIQSPDGKLHKATRVAADEKLDLALLKCEPLTAPPLVLHDRIIPRGTDVMLFGYPEMLVLGASLKATRGAISSLPDPSVNSKYLYDAVSNAGNSGGPLCDAGANVVAVHSTGYNTAGRYAGGVPSTQALEFVKKNLPGFQPSAPTTAKFEWPQVDAQASAATMLIWIRKKNAAVETASVGARAVVELPFCLFCGGLGKVKCDRVGCNGGEITTRQGKIKCPACGGKYIDDCGVCDGVGIDVRLASVQRAAAALAAAKAAKSSPPPAGSTSATPSSRPTSSTGPKTKATTRANLSAPMPALASGGSVDLLAKIDPNQPYSPGSWSVRDGAIVGGRDPLARLAITYQPPAEYDVTIEFRLLNSSGRNSPVFFMGLVSAAGRQFNIAVRDTSVMISGDSGSVLNGTTNSGVDLRQWTKIRYVVRRYEVNVLVDGERLFYRQIDPERCSPLRTFQLVGDDLKHLFLASQERGSEWEIASLILTPVTAAEATTGPPPAPPAASPPTFDREAPTAAAGLPIDLLAKTNPDQSYSPGQWKREGNAIVGGGVTYARFAVPHDLPPEYDLVVDVQKLKPLSEPISKDSTKSGLLVGLISSSGKPFALIVEESAILRSGDDGRTWGVSRILDLGLKNPSQLRFLVRTNEVALLVNGVRVYQCTIDPDKVATYRRVEMSGDDARRLSIGSRGEGTEWRISGMTLVPLN